MQAYTNSGLHDTLSDVRSYFPSTNQSFIGKLLATRGMVVQVVIQRHLHVHVL